MNTLDTILTSVICGFLLGLFVALAGLHGHFSDLVATAEDGMRRRLDELEVSVHARIKAAEEAFAHLVHPAKPAPEPNAATPAAPTAPTPTPPVA
jgi:hypothetical protein